MYRIFALILTALLILTACSAATPDINETGESTVPEIAIHPDRVKCTVPDEVAEGSYYYKCIGERKLRIDYFPPFNQVYEKAPVVFMISGGGFMVCTIESPISEFANEVKKLRDAGFAVASVEYRVGGEGVNVEEVYSDIADGMRYLSYYSDVFGIDPNKFVTAGHSAGGNAALSMAYIGNRAFDTEHYWPEADYQVIGAFSMSGHGCFEKTDYGLYGGYASESIRTNVGLYPDAQMRYRVSPINFLEGSKVPCKILMGKMDNVVAPIFVEKFKEACDAAEVPCEVVWFDNAGHVFESMNGEAVWPRYSVQKSKIVDFAQACVESQQA